MKKPLLPRSIATSLLALVSTLALLGSAHAVTISDSNLFSGDTDINTSSSYNSSNFPNYYLTDGTTSPVIFNDTDATPTLSISGFDSSISTLRFFSSSLYTLRASGSVTILYSSTSYSSAPSLTASNYSLLGTYSLPTDSNNTSYGNTDSDGNAYAELDNLAIPTGTQSLLLEFSQAAPTGNGPPEGPAIDELQAVAAVPEPPAYALLAAAGALVVVSRMTRFRTSGI